MTSISFSDIRQRVARANSGRTRFSVQFKKGLHLLMLLLVLSFLMRLTEAAEFTNVAKSQVLVRIHGGEACDGVAVEEKVLSVGLCIIEYNYVERTGVHGAMYGYADASGMKPISSYAYDIVDKERSKEEGGGTYQIIVKIEFWKGDGQPALACDNKDDVIVKVDPFYQTLSIRDYISE